MYSFNAKIFIIGVNPYVLLPDKVLQSLFADAGKDKGAIQVKGNIDGHHFVQNLVKYAGKWRLYLNTPMRKAAGKDVGDKVSITIAFDPEERIIKMPVKLKRALKKNKEAGAVFDSLPASRRKEIIRYIANLKTEESIQRNVERAISFLSGKERFIGRDKP
jgi:hypothetical protein